MYLFITISGKAQTDTAALSDGRTFQKAMLPAYMNPAHLKRQLISRDHTLHVSWCNIADELACSILQIVYSYYYIIPCGIIKLYCRTALHYAVCKKNLPIVDLLLNCDIVTGLFMQDDEGNNPLHKV